VQLDVEAEVAAIEGVLEDMQAAGEVRIHVLRHAQRMTLRNTLRDFGPHVLHFIGHGRADREGGALVLEKRDGGGDLLSGSMLSTLLKRADVRLAVLNACLTARGAVIEEEDFYEVRRALLGVGPALVDAGLGAVVAMQFSMRDWSARVFAEDFYTTLARLEPVDEAVSRAREALMLQFGEDQRDWATPVLFLRAPDGVIFR
jgi:CHAT domain-containing protein